MSTAARAVSADEFAGLPDDDHRYELVAGRVHRMSPVGGVHGLIVVRLAAALDMWVQAHGLGVVLVETGFVLATGPDTVRAPDIAFVRRNRIPAHGVPSGFWRGAPDLAVEVASPDDRAAIIDAKVHDYLRYGSASVWVVQPHTKSVTIAGVSSPPARFDGDTTITDTVVLAGFGLRLAHLFAAA